MYIIKMCSVGIDHNDVFFTAFSLLSNIILHCMFTLRWQSSSCHSEVFDVDLIMCVLLFNFFFSNQGV